MLSLARGFSDAGCTVDFVLARATGVFVAELPDSLRVIDLGSRSTVASLPGLVRYLRDVRPAAMLSTLAHANAVAVTAGVLSGHKTRVYVREASTFPMDIPPGPRGRVLAALLPRLYKRADGIIAVSSGVAKHLAATFHVDPQRIRVIYNPVIGPALFDLAAQSISHAWFRQGEPPVVLAAGSLKQAKDFATLIRAFKLVRTEARARLMILGEGEERAALESLANDLGLAEDVVLPGFVSNPFPYMRAAAVFVLSSKTEGLPNVLIQALALGTPAVSTDCPHGPREICSGNSRAQLVPVGNSRAMARAILDSLGLSKEACASVNSLRRFHVSETVAQFINALGFSRS
jgi:glycosyltransferase involved in cell wall biosynthesis